MSITITTTTYPINEGAAGVVVYVATGLEKDEAIEFQVCAPGEVMSDSLPLFPNADGLVAWAYGLYTGIPGAYTANAKIYKVTKAVTQIAGHKDFTSYSFPFELGTTVTVFD